MRPKKFLSLLLLPLLGSFSAQADLQVYSSLRVTDGLSAWIKSYGQALNRIGEDQLGTRNGYTECRPVIEVPGTYLCLHPTLKEMNSTLGRATVYVEGLGGLPQSQVPSFTHPTFKKLQNLITGHDLTGKNLLRFHNAVASQCQKGISKSCYNSREKEVFESFIVPKAKAQSSFVLIAFSYRSPKSGSDVVSHEILHAQYFSDSVFRKTVQDFWRQKMSSTDKSRIRSLLGKYYDSRNEDLMINEFQAYLLRSKASRDILSSYVPKYRNALIKELRRRGSPPVQVQ